MKKLQAIDTLKSLALNIAKEYGTNIKIEVDVDLKKGIAKPCITQYNL